MSGRDNGDSYRDNYEHLEAELRWTDLLIGLKVRTMAWQDETAAGAQASRAVYITPMEADWLLRHGEVPPADDDETVDLRAQLWQVRGEIDRRVVRSLDSGVSLALPRLGHLFGLSAFERQVIVICLAPELRRKYDRLYAYLQDDVTRKRPSVDLVLELLCWSEAERWDARRLLTDSGTLRRAGLIDMVDDPHSPSGSSSLAQFLKLDARIAGFLLGEHGMDGRLMAICRVLRPDRDQSPPIDAGITAGLWRLIAAERNAEFPDDRALIVHLHGPRGVGKRELALHMCGCLDVHMLSVDAELLLAKGPEGAALLRLAFREGLLRQAVLYVEPCDALLLEAGRSLLKALQPLISEFGQLIFLGGETAWDDKAMFADSRFHSTALPHPDVTTRVAVWRAALASQAPEAAGWAEPLAAQFRLTPRQIRSAVQLAHQRCLVAADERPMAITDLAAACREQSSHRLRELAVGIDRRYGWDDLVIAPDRLAQLREICNQVRHQHRVFGAWGFGRKLSHGKGLSILFSGQSGTGKTMAAQVVAQELGLDLYQIDLSGVVSKYIGETEKNLSRVFAEAETSNAILFFDEADALFGKRTALSDAHDRYANIETSYLLQKMEEYEGVVILATNLRENMDDAFVRRLRFIVDFPFPDQASRQRIWETHFPAQAPVSPDVDCRRLAQDFKIAGGTIKNIVLNAAFLAAADGGFISTQHLLQGTRREFEKAGKPWSQA